MRRTRGTVLISTMSSSPTAAWVVELLDEPTDIPILAPLLQKEILHRLRVGDQGMPLRQIAMKGSHGQQITKALDWLREHSSKPLRIEELASRAGMSFSTFHHPFRSPTAMSPLQFQNGMNGFGRSRPIQTIP